jgi:hypothetical protein
MTKNRRSSIPELATQQGAIALLKAVFAFLHRNNISKQLIVDFARQFSGGYKSPQSTLQYRRLTRAYEDMGMIMSAWYSLPRYLDRDSRPLPLSAVRGPQSVASLVRSSRVKISAALAIELMRQSPSIRIDTRGKFIALKRVFFLPGFEVSRAALVMDRYLDTLRRNTSAHRNGTTLLLERNCHVPQIDLARITPILRDIKARGTAFMDSIDGDIEAHRIRRFTQKEVGELGVLVFAWTRRSKTRRPKSKPKAKFASRPGRGLHIKRRS